MDRSSSDLSFYGGKTAIEGGTRLHASERGSAILFTHATCHRVRRGSKRRLSSLHSGNHHRQGVDRTLIYQNMVRDPPFANPHADGISDIFVRTPLQLLNSIMAASELRFEHPTPCSNSWTTDLLFVNGIVTKRSHKHRLLLPHVSTCLGVRDTRRRMSGTRLAPCVAPRIRHVSPKSPLNMPC